MTILWQGTYGLKNTSHDTRRVEQVWIRDQTLYYLIGDRTHSRPLRELGRLIDDADYTQHLGGRED